MARAQEITICGRFGNQVVTNPIQSVLSTHVTENSIPASLRVSISLRRSHNSLSPLNEACGFFFISLSPRAKKKKNYEKDRGVGHNGDKETDHQLLRPRSRVFVITLVHPSLLVAHSSPFESVMSSVKVHGTDMLFSLMQTQHKIKLPLFGNSTEPTHYLLISLSPHVQYSYRLYAYHDWTTYRSTSTQRP
ncbi:hypothetical protein BJV78DRAFT_368489 [Lactifluus subvellereus]|nr:hypothetical protein BJV78DRAFT_368489 [Lactifluus subvellereus]